MKLTRKLRYVVCAFVVPFALIIPGNAFAAAGLNGYLSLIGGWTNDHTGIVFSGKLPTNCTDLSLSLLNPVTGTVDMTFVSNYDLGFVINNGNWSLNLGANNAALVSGNYDIFLESMCGSGSYLNPTYEDYFPDAISVEPTGCDNTCMPLHRFYDFLNGSHFYTDSDPEGHQVNLASTNYTYEGIDSFVEGQQVAGSVSVYRFYNLQNGSHFYTTNLQEAQQINFNETAYYHYEGIAFYTFATQVANSVPVYRFYDFQNGTHFYTTNQAEATQVNNTEYTTYQYEGIVGYNISSAN